MMADMQESGWAKINARGGSCEPTANATTTPRNMAMPPSRGVGRLCTSLARIFG